MKSINIVLFYFLCFIFLNSCKSKKENPMVSYKYQPFTVNSSWIYQYNQNFYDSLIVTNKDTLINNFNYKVISYNDSVSYFWREADDYLYQYIDEDISALPDAFIPLKLALKNRDYILIKQNGKRGDEWSTTFNYLLKEYRLYGQIINENLILTINNNTYHDVIQVIYKAQERNARLVPIGDLDIWTELDTKVTDTIYYSKNIGSLGNIKNRKLYKYQVF